MSSRRTAVHLASISFVAAAVLLLGSSASSAQSPDQPANQGTPSATPPRVFASDAGLVLNFVKPDKAADFELVMGKLREALQKSDNADRRQQGQSWKIYRAVEPGAGGNVLFVFVIDPPVKNADYTVSTILAEAFPADVQDLYRKFAESYASGQNIVNLTTVAPAMAQP